MKVLVTGAAGFIGSHVAERLLGRGDDVVGFDAFDTLLYDRATKERNLRALTTRQRFTFIEGDLRNQTQVIGAMSGGVQAVFHAAALAGVRPSMNHAALYADVNVVGTMNLFSAAQAVGVRNFVFASSSSVYGATSPTPFHETDPCDHPASPYAASKRAAELLLKSIVSPTAVSCLRFFNVYGPRQRPDQAIARFTQLLMADQPIALFGDGTTSRDYTYVDDIVDVVMAALRDADRTPFRVCNVGGGRPVALADLVAKLAEALKKTPQIINHPEQPGELRHTLADGHHAFTQWGFRPRISIDEGLMRFVAWWQAEHLTV